MHNRKIFHNKAISLNSARNCLKFVIRAFDIKSLNIPFYICPVIWQAAREEGCSIKFYHINKDFMPSKEFEADEFIIYPNYFGICASNVKQLLSKYQNLIIDNAHAFYMPTQESALANIYSPRKFFKVPDGGYLYSSRKNLTPDFPQATSYLRISNLEKPSAKEESIGFLYNEENEKSLGEEPIYLMSEITKKILSSTNYKAIQKQRLENFKYLHTHLKETNELNITLTEDDVPMVYPYFTKDETISSKLAENKINIEQYWQPLKKGSIEADFQKYILPLPIDQIYTQEDMQKILNAISVNII